MAIAGLQGFAFKGQHSNDFGIILNSLKRSILPPLSPKSVIIPYRAGSQYFGSQVGERTFSLTITVEGTDTDDLNAKLHSIANWLQSDQEEEIVFDKEVDKSYFGFFTGQTDLAELVTIGETTLTFTCADPYAYGVEVESAEQTASPFNIDVAGTENTHPDIFVKFKQNSTYFTIATKEQAIYLGENNVENTLVAANAKVINDDMSTLSLWQNSATVENGTVGGSFTTNGYTFQSTDHGTGSTWHGAAMQRMIQTPLQDFELSAYVGLYATTQGQMGKLAFWLLDVNGNHIGKIELSDSSGYEVSKFYARAGAQYAGGDFVNGYSDYISNTKKRVTNTKKVKGKDVTYYTYTPEEYGTLRDFAGTMYLRRVGNVWTAGLFKLDPKTGKCTYYRSFKYVDKKNQFNQQVAGVKLHMGQWATTAYMNAIWVSNVTLLNVSQITDTDTQEIFHANDELHISCEDGSVLLNGEPYMSALDISSQFFPLTGNATNQLAFEPHDKAAVTINHRPRYL